MNLRIPLPRHPVLAGFLAWSWYDLARRRALHITANPDDLYEINGILCDRSPRTHVGSDAFAVDFLVPDGTPILACLDGEVVDFKDDGFLWARPSDRNSPAPHHLNHITLKHPAAPGLPLGFNTKYCYVERGSFRSLGLKRGDQVKKGQQIGISCHGLPLLLVDPPPPERPRPLGVTPRLAVRTSGGTRSVCNISLYAVQKKESAALRILFLFGGSF